MEAAIELIINYFLEKGGVYGLLFVLALAWIIFRERYLWNNSKNQGVDGKKIDEFSKDIKTIEVNVNEYSKSVKEIESDVEKVLLLLDRIKDTQKENCEQVSNLTPALDRINTMSHNLEKKVDDLHDWHAVFDNEGVPIWYVRKSIVESIDTLDKTIQSLKIKLLQSHDSLKLDFSAKLQKVNDKRVDELKTLLENYNTTVTELIVALEKIKTLLKTEDS